MFGAQGQTRTGTPRRTRHFKCRMSTIPSLGHLAERVGFEPTDAFASSDFKSGVLSRALPSLHVVDMAGFEPAECDSQSVVPYLLATSQYTIGRGSGDWTHASITRSKSLANCPLNRLGMPLYGAFCRS